MKFRFLGDADCPDWLLAEINTLSRMTSIKMKVLGQLVAKSLTEGTLDEDKVKKLTQDAKLEPGDTKAIVAALNLILSSSTSHAVSATDLSSELQQLGLPREHSTTLARIYTEHSPQITATLSAQSLRLKRLSFIETLENEKTSPFVKIAFQTSDTAGKEETNKVTIPKESIPVLLAELKRARSLMEGL
ncbi:COMM domain-containing protein 4 isoform X1 [Neodiprion lecontei]|uniref:COMM domain-containing protein 4 isoform X1 n=2 Tax=Neodiprion lecontei TaxID=441921 RepID=A0A6J0C4Z8_NEOLC|nr:COMM domain-containing protein 4 isoform X1 [Neodiprion lecontei]XP_046591563.1 COMM domain-containing protein 4 isoform X1 [Neodiprion lecontei]